MDSPPVQSEPEEPGALPVPLADEDLPAWWGPILDLSAEDRDQLGGIVLDLDEIADATGSDPDVLREFASAHPPARRYLIAEPLSVTVWAAVYVAIDMATMRPMVLKVSRREVEIEGLLIAKYDHPNVVKALDVFVYGGYPTTVLEWCRHGTLRTHAYEGVAHWRDVLKRAIEAGRGLAYLHERGLVHGDVKPSNILITHGTGKIADLGLAGPERLNGATWGTPLYAPPEREHGVFVFAGDVYSLALTIERSLHGHDGVPESIGRVLEAALATDYQHRPPLVQLLADLDRELQREPLALERRELEQGREAQQIEQQRIEQQRIEQQRIEQRIEQQQREFERRRRRLWLQTAVMFAVLACVGGSAAIAAVCGEPATTERHIHDVDLTLGLAVRAADRGDGVAAIQFLELAARHGKLDSEHETLRRVAIVAESLGHRFVAAGDRISAGQSWSEVVNKFETTWHRV